MPLIAPSLFAGGLLVFLLAVNELTVSALLWSAGNETLGVLIFNLDEGAKACWRRRWPCWSWPWWPP